jgi:hypothetical protein
METEKDWLSFRIQLYENTLLDADSNCRGKFKDFVKTELIIFKHRLRQIGDEK